MNTLNDLHKKYNTIHITTRPTIDITEVCFSFKPIYLLNWKRCYVDYIRYKRIKKLTESAASEISKRIEDNVNKHITGNYND